MPFLPGTFDAAATGTSRLAMASATQADVGRAASAIHKQDYGLAATVAGDLGLGAVDLADTVFSSIPVLSKAFGLERGSINSAALNSGFASALGMPGLQDFYNDNKAGIEAVSGIYGIIGAEMVSRKLTAPAGLAITALKALPWGKRIATLDMQYNRAMKAVRFADESLAARGALGAEQFVGRVAMPAEGLAGLSFGAKAGQEATRKGLYNSARFLGAAKGVRNAAVTEGIMGVTLNQNGFLYDDDMSHNLMWMAGGLVGAGAFEAIGAAYQLRKSVNSDYIRRIYANALDPGGEEGARLAWHGKTVEAGKFKGLGDIPAGQGFLGGTFTDNVTSLLVGAKSKTGTPTDVGLQGQWLKSNRDNLATQELQQAREEIQKVTVKGIEGNGFTRFAHQTQNSSGAMNHIDQVMQKDPAGFYGIEEMGVVPEGKAAFDTHLGRELRINEIVDQSKKKLEEIAQDSDYMATKKGVEEFESLQDTIRRYEWKKQFIPTPLIDGERATISDLRTLDNWQEPHISVGKTPDDIRMWSAEAAHTGRRVELDASGKHYLPDNVPINKADHFDILRLYRAGQQMIEHAKGNTVEMALPKGADWFQLDLAEQVLRVNPSANITFPAGMTREAAQVESFAQKAEILRAENRKAQMKSIKDRSYDPEVEASKLRVRLNLPKLSAYERGVLGETEHPLEQLLRGAAEFGPDEIRKLGLNDLMKGASDVKRIGDFAPTSASDFKDLMGNSFRYMLDEKGAPTRPVLMYSRPINKFEWASDELAERMAASRQFVVSKMAEGDTFNARLTQELLNSPNLDAASKTRGLMETQIQGSLMGTNHLGGVGAFNKATRARDWIGRDNETLLAASRMQETVQRLARDNFQQEAKGLQTIVAQLDNPRNTASKLLLNQFLAYRPGWDMAIKKGVPVTVAGQIGENAKPVAKFLLAQTEKNQKRWQQMFGEAMPENAVLTGPNRREVVLDDFGAAFMGEYNKMTDSVLKNKNQMLAAQGLRGIDNVPMYVPPSNLDGKFIGFTQDVEGNVVSGMTVIASTEADFAKQQAGIMKMIEDEGLHGYRFRTRDSINRYADIWDRAQMDMIDPGTTAIQGGKVNLGKLASADIDMKGVEGVLATLRSQYMNHAQDVLGTIMKDQLRSAESRSAIATGLSRNAANPMADQKYRSIHDMYIENLTGRSPLRSKGSAIGGFYNWAEGKADQLLAQGHPGFAKGWEATQSFINRTRIWDKSEGSKKDFESLTKYLGDYMPFKTSAEYAERMSGAGMPPQLKDLMGATSRFTSAMMLRIFEPAMAVMNMAGMVNAMPSVIRHVQQQAGETVAEHAQRIGHISTIFEGAGRNGESIGVLNMGKLMTRGFNRAWSKEAHVDFEYMRANGFLTQEVAEFQRQFGAIDSKSSFMQFLTGSQEGARVAKGRGTTMGKVEGAIKEKGIVGHLSVLTDKSEDFSRSWGHMVGLELAEHLGITKMEAKHQFAHDMANKMIANYNPGNRPEVYQGALGAPLGLFQSFVMNYYQRMFRYIESGDVRSAAVQSAMQASLFGVPTVPGFAAASAFFLEHGGEGDPVTAIQSKFGGAAGDLLFGGVLSNIPKMFGAEGVDLYSRGDTAIRLPNPTAVPAATMALKLAKGGADLLGLMGTGVKDFINGNPNMTTTQIAEVLSNTVPNRPIAGVIEQLFAGGNDTDSAGQIASDTKSMMEGVYRMLGVRSMRQSKEIEAFYSNKNQMTLQNSQMDQLRHATRTAFREGNMDAVPVILEKYIEQGGDPRNARRWLKEQFEAATKTRGERQLEASLKSPDKMGYAVRLLDAGVSIDDDEATTPYSESIAVDSSEFGQVNHQMMDYEADGAMTLADAP